VGSNHPAEKDAQTTQTTQHRQPNMDMLIVMSENIYYNLQDKFIAIDSIYQKLSEIFDKVDCLQRAVARVCGQQSDFKVEYAEDMTEVKRLLHELRRNKVWTPRERVLVRNDSNRSRY